MREGVGGALAAFRLAPWQAIGVAAARWRATLTSSGIVAGARVVVARARRVRLGAAPGSRRRGGGRGAHRAQDLGRRAGVCRARAWARGVDATTARRERAAWARGVGPWVRRGDAAAARRGRGGGAAAMRGVGVARVRRDEGAAAVARGDEGVESSAQRGGEATASLQRDGEAATAA